MEICLSNQGRKFVEPYPLSRISEQKLADLRPNLRIWGGQETSRSGVSKVLQECLYNRCVHLRIRCVSQFAQVAQECVPLLRNFAHVCSCVHSSALRVHLRAACVHLRKSCIYTCVLDKHYFTEDKYHIQLTSQ